MKDKTIDIIQTVFFTVLFLLLVGGLLIIFISSSIIIVKNEKLCHSNFGMEYSWLDTSTYNYEYVDETHYNCCWDETHYDEEEGYYKKERCKGFVE